MIFSKELIIQFHIQLIELTGGHKGLRDEKMLESSVNSIYQSFNGVDLYKTIIEKAAWLCYSINRNHPFIDGNKRVSMHSMAVFLRFHDIDYSPSEEEVIKVGFALADGSMDYQALISWLKKSTSIK